MSISSVGGSFAHDWQVSPDWAAREAPEVIRFANEINEMAGPSDTREIESMYAKGKALQESGLVEGDLAEELARAMKQIRDRDLSQHYPGRGHQLVDILNFADAMDGTVDPDQLDIHIGKAKELNSQKFGGDYEQQLAGALERMVSVRDAQQAGSAGAQEGSAGTSRTAQQGIGGSSEMAASVLRAVVEGNAPPEEFFVGYGTELYTAKKEAVRAANERGVAQRFTHWGTEFTAHPGDKLEDIPTEDAAYAKAHEPATPLSESEAASIETETFHVPAWMDADEAKQKAVHLANERRVPQQFTHWGEEFTAMPGDTAPAEEVFTPRSSTDLLPAMQEAVERANDKGVSQRFTFDGEQFVARPGDDTATKTEAFTYGS
jgi:hypothetical protein